MRLNNLTVFAVTVFTLAACATNQPVAPGEFFPGPLLNVHAPTSEGWLLMLYDANGISFARRDLPTGKTYVAQIIAHHRSPVNTPDELLAIFKAETERDYLPDRFKPIELHFQLISERPYPCVQFRGTFEDLKSQRSQGTISLLFHFRSLFCQHPTQRSLGFLISYSERGGLPDPDLDFRAQSFIDGIQVP